MRSRTKFWWPEFGIASLLAAWFIVLFRNLNLNMMWSFGDLPPFPATYDQGIQTFVTSWQSQSLGNAIPRTPLLVVFGALQLLLGNDGSLAQKVLYLSLLPIGSAFMYWSLGQLTSSRMARFVGAFIFVANPVINGEFVGGAVGLLFCYALLPLIVKWTLTVAWKPREFAPWIRLSLLVLAYAWITPQVMPLLAVTMFLAWCSARVEGGARISIRDLAPRLAFLCGTLVLLYAWFFFESPLGGAVASLPVGSLLGEVRINYSMNTTEGILRLAYWSFVLQPLGYAFPTPLTALGFFLPILAFSGFLQRTMRRPLYLAFSVLSLGMIGFIALAHSGFLNGVFAAFPLLFIYRGPTMPLYFLVFSYAIQATISISDWTEHSAGEFRLFSYIRGRLTNLRKSTKEPSTSGRRPVIALVTLSMLAGALYVSPMLDGTVGLSATRGNNYVVSAELSDIAEWVQVRRQSEGFFRTLWVPLTFEDYNALSWIDPYIFAVPLGARVYGYPNLDFISNTLEMLCSSSTTSIGVLLGEASVKYVILNLASSSTGSCSENGGLPSGSPTVYHSLLNSQTDLKPVAFQSTFIAYVNLHFQPRVTISGNPLIILNGPETEVMPVEQRLSPNLLTNPEFQQNGSGWNAWLPQFISYEEVNGTSPMLVALIRPADANIPQTWVPEVWQLLPAAGESWYNLSFEARLTNAVSTSVRLTWFPNAERVNALGTVSIAVPSGSPTDVGGWSMVTETVRAPSGSNYLSVEFQGGFSLDGINPSVVMYHRPAIYRVSRAGQPPATDEAVALLASELPFSEGNRPPLLVVSSRDELEGTKAATGTVHAIVYVNNPEERSNIAALAGPSIHGATFMSSAVGILQVESGSWYEASDPVYTANVMAVARSNASGYLNLTGLNLGASTIWIRGVVDGKVTFSEDGKSERISDSSSEFSWYRLNMTLPVDSIPFQFEGMFLSLAAFVIQPINESALWLTGRSRLSVESNEFGSDLSIRAEGGGPTTVFLRDSFDQGWQAIVASQPMTHLRSAFGFNIFTLASPPSNATIHIFHVVQETRNAILVVTSAFVAMGVAWIVVSERARIQRVISLILHPLGRNRKSDIDPRLR